MMGSCEALGGSPLPAPWPVLSTDVSLPAAQRFSWADSYHGANLLQLLQGSADFAASRCSERSPVGKLTNCLLGPRQALLLMGGVRNLHARGSPQVPAL